MNGWAIWLPESALAALGELRLQPGIDALEDERGIWLRVSQLDERLAIRLRSLPGGKRFTVHERNEIVPHEARLPVDVLPEGKWLPLRQYLSPELPLNQSMRVATSPISLLLIQSAAERQAVAVRTDFAAWLAYAATAPAIRLAPLRFAVSVDRRVFITGDPLPPLTGEFFWEEEGIFVAAGYEWSPAVQADVVRQCLHLEPQEVVIWQADGVLERIAETDFVAARRVAVRHTAEALNL